MTFTIPFIFNHDPPDFSINPQNCAQFEIFALRSERLGRPRLKQAPWLRVRRTRKIAKISKIRDFPAKLGFPRFSARRLGDNFSGGFPDRLLSIDFFISSIQFYLALIMKIFLGLFVVFTFSTLIQADEPGSTNGKTFIDYFLPTPILSPLSKDAWGAASVGPRDQKNGLEDPTLAQWDYWDGRIIKTADGKYHIFGSRWDQSKGHGEWRNSKAIHAVSDNLFGPYVDKGICWPDDMEGKGHNVSAVVLPDGTYAIVTSETRPGDVFTAQSVDGPWRHIGRLQIADGPYKELAHMSNVAPMVRPDGEIECIARSGAIWISKTGILGPYEIQGPSIYPTIDGLDKNRLAHLEDPVMWYSGGLYHILVNNWSDRRAYHLTSVDGITDWKYRGVAYEPDKDFIRYTDGTVNHWNKLERPSVYLENGHVVAVTLAVIDVPKDDEHGNDGHGSKIVVIPFDGAALDKDLGEDTSSTPTPAPTDTNTAASTNATN